MLSLSAAFVHLAVALLPVTEQARFRVEWRAEVETVREQFGNRAAALFAGRLVLAAPRMTLQMRAGSQSAFAELSIGLSFSIFPSAVLVGLAILTGVWIMVAAELSIIFGVILMASGFWSFEGRLLDSKRSRVGLVLATVGSIVEVVMRRLVGFGPPIDDVVSASIPHAVIMVGLILWVASSYAGRFRFRILLLAVGLLAPGAAINTVIAVINGWSLTGFDRFSVLMYVIPSGALAWACYSVLGRREIFDDRVLVEA